MKRTTERKWHSWRNGVALTICPSMWRRQRRLCWTSGGGTPLTTPHWPSTARLWRESAALNSSTKITEDLTWTTNTMSLSKKAQQCLHFLRRLKRASLPPPILTTFYRGTIESVLTSCITVWYGNCSASDRKTLQRTVNMAAKVIGAPLPSILDIFLARCSSKTNSIVKDPTHPSHSLFQLLPSGRRYRSIRARSARLLNSFFPQAVRALNPNHPALLWNPMQTPTSWNMDHPPSPNTPQPYHTKEKTVWNFFVQFKCATHRWVGLYKPPVVTHSPLCALDTASCLTHNVSLCTCTLFMWSIRIVCIVCIFYLLSLVA